LLTGRWELTAFGGPDMPASFFVNTCDAQRDRMGPQKTASFLLWKDKAMTQKSDKKTTFRNYS